MFFDGVEYDLTLIDDSANVYGGGGGSVDLTEDDIVTFSNPVTANNLDITLSKILELEDTLTITGDYTNYGQLAAGTAKVVRCRYTNRHWYSLSFKFVL